MAQSLLLPSSFNLGLYRAIPPQVLLIKRRKVNLRAISRNVIRCEQGTQKKDGLDVWLSRGAMLGFTAAITVELTTGKGLLQNFGFSAPLPTIALSLTALIGLGATFYIFQSASRD